MEKERVISSLLLLASVLTTCFLETRLIRTKQTFDEGRKLAIALPEPVALPANDGRLVHFTGRIMTDTASADKENQRDRVEAGALEARTYSTRSSPFVLDATFGVAVKGVRLHRKVEMLQWVESSHVSTASRDPEDDEPVSQERVYRYDLEWRAEHVDSNAFYQMGYWNPPREAWRFESETVQAPNLVVGDFELTNELIDQIQRKDPVKLDAANRATMANVLTIRLGDTWEQMNAARNLSLYENKYFYVHANHKPEHLQTSDSYRDPVLGDLRISFDVTPAYPVTICAQQQLHELSPFVVTKTGEAVFLLEDGMHSVDELFNTKTATKVRHNLFYRLFACVVGFIGFLVARPWLLLKFGFGLAFPKPIFAGTSSIALTVTVVSLNWFIYRPLWSVAVWAAGLSPLAAAAIFYRRAKTD